jgi:hypothetical protein
MKKVLIAILFFALAFAACRKDDSSSGGFDLLNSDQTSEAAKIIDAANADLKEVRAIYRANQDRVEEVNTAMANKDVEKVKTIADDLVIQINRGVVTAEKAVEKIKEAERMDINPTYKEYLGLKIDGLEKQIAAFELRRQVALLVRDSFGGKDTAKIEQAKGLFREKEQQFEKLIKEGTDLSEKANDVYKESLKPK